MGVRHCLLCHKSLEAVWWTNCNSGQNPTTPTPTHRKIILVDRDWVLFCRLCLPRSHRPERLVFSVAISQPMKSGHLKQHFPGRRRSRLSRTVPEKKSRRTRNFLDHSSRSKLTGTQLCNHIHDRDSAPISKLIGTFYSPIGPT
jgi:hypothetical protein